MTDDTYRKLARHLDSLPGGFPRTESGGPGQMTYDLRRLRLKGPICRKAGTTRYELTPYGRNASLFLARLYQRVLRPGLAAAVEPPWKVDVPHPLREILQQVNAQIDHMLTQAHLRN